MITLKSYHIEINQLHENWLDRIRSDHLDQRSSSSNNALHNQTISDH